MGDLEAAQARIKALMQTVRELEEQRGMALLRVAALEGDVDDRTLARGLAGAMPRHAKRVVSCRVLAVMLALTQGPLDVHSLRDVLDVAQATASAWLKEALDVGVVELVPDEGDRRRHVAQLTAKGWVYVRDCRRRSPDVPVAGDDPGDEPATDP